MLCRVGITADLSERWTRWEREHPSMRNWTLSLPYFTKGEAQRVETRLGVKHGCIWHWGGGDPERKFWYVYHFEFDPLEDRRLKNPDPLDSLYNFAGLDMPTRPLGNPFTRYPDDPAYRSSIDVGARPSNFTPRIWPNRTLMDLDW